MIECRAKEALTVNHYLGYVPCKGSTFGWKEVVFDVAIRYH